MHNKQNERHTTVVIKHWTEYKALYDFVNPDYPCRNSTFMQMQLDYLNKVIAKLQENINATS